MRDKINEYLCGNFKVVNYKKKKLAQKLVNISTCTKLSETSTGAGKVQQQAIYDEPTPMLVLHGAQRAVSLGRIARNATMRTGRRAEPPSKAVATYSGSWYVAKASGAHVNTSGAPAAFHKL